jgi:hypothetical protein
MITDRLKLGIVAPSGTSSHPEPDEFETLTSQDGAEATR